MGINLKNKKKTNPYGIAIFQAHVKKIYQILVRLEDTFKQPIAVAATIFVPLNGDKSKLLAYNTAEDAAYINCSPSYAMQLWAIATTLFTSQIAQLNTIAALSKGWYVLVTDHEGPKSKYVAGYLAGYAVLNSIKATLHFNETQLDTNAKVATWGYSSGTVAAGWTAHCSQRTILNLTWLVPHMVVLLLTLMPSRERIWGPSVLGWFSQP